MPSRKGVRRRSGQVLQIPLGDGASAFGRVLTNPLIGFYDLRSETVPPIEQIIAAPILFKLWVMRYTVAKGRWHVLGHVPLSHDLLVEPLFFKKDALTGALTIYRDRTGEEVPATLEECEGLECAAVWDPEHLEDRLRDHHAGRPCRWLKALALNC
jgi:hypothetical protein